MTSRSGEIQQSRDFATLHKGKMENGKSCGRGGLHKGQKRVLAAVRKLPLKLAGNGQALPKHVVLP
jgi:hypothetical protein